jgi:hypothetical protein
MPHGFFTIDEWKSLKRGQPAQWVTVCHVSADKTLTQAIEELEILGKPGFFRVVQTQRMVWAEMEDGKLRLRRSHTMTPESLARTAEAFDRDGGRYPVEEARRIRANQKLAQTARKKSKRTD